MKTTPTTEDITGIEEALGLGDTALVETGNYSSGFWHNELRVDLEDLKDGKYSAFAVIEDIHDTAGTSFRAYYGIDHYAKLPSGVNNQAIIEFCASLYARREELTTGLEIEWDNSNEKAVWYDEDGDNCEPNSYWSESFADDVRDLSGREVYDLSLSDNYPYVKEGIEPLPEGVDATDANAVLAHITTVGYENDGEYIYIGHDAFAVRYAQEAADDSE